MDGFPNRRRWKPIRLAAERPRFSIARHYPRSTGAIPTTRAPMPSSGFCVVILRARRDAWRTARTDDANEGREGTVRRFFLCAEVYDGGAGGPWPLGENFRGFNRSTGKGPPSFRAPPPPVSRRVLVAGARGPWRRREGPRRARGGVRPGEDARGPGRRRKGVAREDGQLLIQSPSREGPAAGLSTLPRGVSNQVKHKPAAASSPLCAGVRPVEDGGEKEVEALPGTLANSGASAEIGPRGRTSTTGGTYAAGSWKSSGIRGRGAAAAVFNRRRGRRGRHRGCGRWRPVAPASWLRSPL